MFKNHSRKNSLKPVATAYAKIEQMATDTFRAALESYADALQEKFSTSTVNANPEDQLKTPVENLLRAVIPGLLASPLKVQVKTEVQETHVGRPDVGVILGGLLAGHIELKAPDKPADPQRLKTKHDKAQWEKFQALPNLIYTNGSDWLLFQRVDTGDKIELQQIGQTVKLGDLVTNGKSGLNSAGVDALEVLFRSFLNWEPITPSTPKKLAQLLAPLTRILRDDVSSALNDESSNIYQVAGEWRQTLFPDADDKKFADAYAQTVTYALLLARLEGSEDSDEAPRTLRSGHPLLADILKLLTDDALRDELGVGLKVLIRVIDALDVSAFAGEGDPWIYFYEDFLAQYDPDLRKQYGVYYTPQEIIKAQVVLADDLLRNYLGKSRGLAQEGVILLDPATGTGAYPLRVIEFATNKYGKLGKGAIATRLGSQMHAFEILVGPYTVAHLRVTQAITQAQGSMPDKGAQVYLADTLDSPYAEIPNQLGFVYKPLTEEHKRVQEVKQKTPVMVCFGNPPYRRWPAEDAENDVRYGGWVRHGDAGKEGVGILNSFTKPVQDAGNGLHVRNLYNDYVAFWRWAMWKVFENKDDPRAVADRVGIVSFITASSYLRGPAFAGMRQQMRQTFDHLWILDLGGEGRGAVKDENVFAIQTPVCIGIGLRSTTPQPEKPATVRYFRVEGKREDKLSFLAGLETIEDINWKICPTEWQKPLIPQSEGDFFSWPLLTDLFPSQFTGAKYHRKWPIGETKTVLEQRWRRFASSAQAERAALFGETRDRDIRRTYPQLEDAQRRTTPLISVDENSPLPRIERLSYRSFDRMWVFADTRLGDYVRAELWRSFSLKQVFLSGLLTKQTGEGPSLTVSAHVPDIDYFSGRGAKDIIPLYLDADAKTPNILPGLLEKIEEKTGKKVSAEELFSYAYALLASPDYEERFREELVIPGPRLPITLNADLFSRVAEAGRELIHLQTYGERMGKGGIPEGNAGVTKDIPADAKGYPTEFNYDADTKTLHVGDGEIFPVAPEVWNFEVSGLRVLRSWLSYRMKVAAGRSSSDLDKIRPEKWTPELTEELLDLIWLLEGTISGQPKLAQLLKEVLESNVLTSAELPEVKKEETTQGVETPMFGLI